MSKSMSISSVICVNRLYSLTHSRQTAVNTHLAVEEEVISRQKGNPITSSCSQFHFIGKAFFYLFPFTLTNSPKATCQSSILTVGHGLNIGAAVARGKNAIVDCKSLMLVDKSCKEPHPSFRR